jgi:hypothetical protein
VLHEVACVCITEDMNPQLQHQLSGQLFLSGLLPLHDLLKPPTYVKKGARVYGFTLRTIRVYHGDTDYYTLHHLAVVSMLDEIREEEDTLISLSLVCFLIYSEGEGGFV